MLVLVIFASGFLRWLTDNSHSTKWEDTATSWLIAALVIAVICAAATMIVKAISKSLAKNVEQKIWSRGQTILLIIAGLAPVIAIMFCIWYLTRDYFNFKGVHLGWLLYLVLIFFAHIASPWRRELI
jgi:uncharacterized membrane protein YbjE (DUF340 family)